MRLRVFGVCFAICGATVAAAQDVSDESLARVRGALQKPPSLFTVQMPKPDFTVYVEGRRPLADIFERPPWVEPPDELAAPKIRTVIVDPAIGHPTTMTAGGSVDPGVIGHSIARAFRTRAARAEVQRAIAEYCIAHREEPGADKICQ